jgi:hypothetical protein
VTPWGGIYMCILSLRFGCKKRTWNGRALQRLKKSHRSDQTDRPLAAVAPHTSIPLPQSNLNSHDSNALRVSGKIKPLSSGLLSLKLVAHPVF